MPELQIQELHKMQDLIATVELQQKIWQMRPYECASPYTMNAVLHNGGNILGATIDGHLVGYTFAFPGVRDSNVWLWSHMAGVHPDFQGQRIGFKLKQAQRLWALANGYDVIAWTFDPMQRGNANFNFSQLGATAKTYYVDHYGAMQDKINAGLASDRLEAVWCLNDPQVISIAQGHAVIGSAEDYPDTSFAVYVDSAGVIHDEIPEQFQHDTYCIEIPYDVAKLKKTKIDHAQRWQQSVRTAITALLGKGFIVNKFISNKPRCWYVLQRTIETG